MKDDADERRQVEHPEVVVSVAIGCIRLPPFDATLHCRSVVGYICE